MRANRETCEVRAWPAYGTRWRHLHALNLLFELKDQALNRDW